jgi:histidine phosphotransferase ChpT
MMTTDDATPAEPRSDAPTAPEAAPPARPVTPVEFATRLAARLCHDFASPTTAIASGLDLIEDPTAQDMRDDAMNLLAVGGRKLGAILSFSRIAFAGSGAADSYDARELEGLAQAIYGHARAELDWAVEPGAVPKAAAQVLLNLAQLGSAVLPMGGTARLEAREADGGMVVTLDAKGARARLRPEAAQGLRGEAMTEGLGGHWVQGYFLHSLVDGAGGTLSFEVEDERVSATAVLPG